MTDIPSLISQIRELLPKVYEGQWSVEEFQQDGATWGNIISGHGTIIAEVRGALDSCGNGDNADWLALLNPGTVTALLDRIEELERELTDTQTANQCYTEDFAVMKGRATTAESKLAEARAEAWEEAALECVRHAKSEMPITRWKWNPWIKGNLERVTSLNRKMRAKAFIRAAAAIRALKSGGANG